MLDTYGNESRRSGGATHACRWRSHMIDRYNRLPPEEQRIVIVTMTAAAAALWLAVAWEEVMVLIAIPLLATLAWALIRSVRRRADRQKEEVLC